MESPLTPGHWLTLQAIAESLDSLDLDRTLLTIRNALVQEAGFDRAGILLVDETDSDYLIGAWGTAPDGGPQSERHWRTRVDEHPNSARILRGEAPYILRHTEVPHIPPAPAGSEAVNQHAVVPLKTHDRTLGVISVDNLFTHRPIHEADVQFLLLVARQVAVAIEKARFHEREHQRTEELSRNTERYVRRLEGLQKASTEVASALSLPEALEGILKAAGDVMDFDRLAIWQVGADGAWKCAVSQRLSDDYRAITEATSHRADGKPWKALEKLQSGEPIIVRDVASSTEWEERRGLAQAEGIRCLVTYPLCFGEELLGTLVFYGDEPDRFSPEDIMLGGLFAHHAATAIHKAKAYEEIRQTRDELSLRVAERTRQLEEAQEQLIRSERLAAIGQVSATITHDLRGPLGVINNAAYLLSLRLQNSDEKVKQTIQTLQTQVQVCSRIINDLLDFSRDIQPNRQPNAWPGVVQSALNTLTVPSGVEVELSLDESAPRASMDADLMVRAVANLIQNAAQITAEQGGGSVEVRNGGDADSTWLEVTDNGPGVQEELRTRIFEPFFTTRTKGTGLGLPLVKRIVEAHDGTVGVENVPGNGARFTIQIPNVI